MSGTTELHRDTGTHRALSEKLVQMFQHAATDLGRRTEDVTITTALSNLMKVGITTEAEFVWREDWRRFNSKERPTDSTAFPNAAALRATMAAEGDAFLAGPAHSVMERTVQADPQKTLLRSEVVPLGHGTRGHIVETCKSCEGECGFPCSCGSGKAQCSSCCGSGSQACYACAGHRTFRNWNPSANRYEEAWCQACRGSGSEPCSGCGGGGKVVCPSCDGKLWHACMDCDATGSVTCVGQAVYEAHLKAQTFASSAQNYDPAITPGPMRTGFFLDFESAMKGANGKSALRDADEIRFNGLGTLAGQTAWRFTATVPFAKVEGLCAGAPFSACMIGSEHRVIMTSRFGDAVLAADLAAVNKGASDPQGAINTARRIPALSRVLDVAAGRSKETIQDIEKSISWVLSTETLENAQTALNAAIGAVSRQAIRRAWVITVPMALLASAIWIVTTPARAGAARDAAYITDAIAGAILAQLLAFGVLHAGRWAEQRAVGARVPFRAAPRWHTAVTIGLIVAHVTLSGLLR